MNTTETKEREKELILTIQVCREALSQLHIKLSNATHELKEICTHSTVIDYRWEHDNGYGHQSWITGKECANCGKVDLWKRGTFIDPSELRNDYAF